jgi:phosphoglycolate phosphatase
MRVEAGDAAFDVDAIAFDKDGTLIDLDAAWGPAARHWVETAAAGDSELTVVLSSTLGLHQGTERLVNGGLFAVGTVGQLYETTLEVLARNGVDGDRARATAALARHASAEAGEKGNLVALGEVEDTMRRLRNAGLKLAVVSSDDRSAIDAAIDALAIASLLDAVVSGDEGLNPKPAPDALLEAARRIGTSPARMLYVGDSWVDAEAGSAAGTAGTVLVGNPTADARARASVVVPSVDSLLVGLSPGR